MRYYDTWKEIIKLPSLKELVPAAGAHMRLLHAVDTFPRGGLCQGVYLKEALRRYEQVWLPLISSQRLAGQPWQDLVPPLDVAFVWHLHRLQPSLYAADCQRLPDAQGHVLHLELEQAFRFTDGSDTAGAAAVCAWRAAHPKEPFYPPQPGAATGAFSSKLSADLAAAAVRVPIFTHQLLRAQYIDRPFLNRALARYAKLLLLRKHRLDLTAPLPMMDMVLMMHTHMSASGPYAADCRELFGRLIEDRPAGARRASRTSGERDGAAAHDTDDAEAGVSCATRDRSLPGPWRYHFLEMKRVWGEEFREPLVLPGTSYIPMDSPHPAEVAMGGLGVLACFEEGSGGGGSWRAGAHALYLTWLRDPRLQQPAAEAKAAAEAAAAAPLPPPPPKKPSGLFACFGCGGGGGADEWSGAQAGAPRPAGPPLTPGQLRHSVAGVHLFKGLPHTTSHRYWRQLEPAGPADEILETGQEGQQLEVFAAPGGGDVSVQAQALANELGDDVDVDIAVPLELSQR